MNKEIANETPAQKIANLHNARVRAGFGGNGFIVCGRDGSGGAWYSSDSYPKLGADEIRVDIGWHSMSKGEAEQLLRE